MYQISNFTDNDDVKILSEMGPFQVVEYQRDLSVSPSSSVTAYYSAQMNVKKRQLVCNLSKAQVTVQAGAMQWMLGNVNATTAAAFLMQRSMLSLGILQDLALAMASRSLPLLAGSAPPSLTATEISRATLVKTLAFCASEAPFFLFILFHLE